jgi:DNA-directed RNA polymerase subunit RPC12/RpoP
MMDELDDRRRRALEQQQVSSEIEDADDEASLRARRRRLDKLKLDVEEQRLLGIMERSLGGGNQDSAMADVLREMNAANQQNLDRMMTLLRGDAQHQSNREIDELKGMVKDLGGRLENAISSNARPANDPYGTAGIVAALDVVSTVREKLNSEPGRPVAEPGMSREQVLHQIAIEEEAEIRRAELRERREDREFAREQAQETARSKRARLASATGMVDQYAGPVLAAILGGKAKDLLGGGSSGTGEAPALNTSISSKKAYQCPECGAVNWEEPETDIATCPACGTTVHPFPQLRAPGPHQGPAGEPHHHHEQPVGPPDDDPA